MRTLRIMRAIPVMRAVSVRQLTAAPWRALALFIALPLLLAACVPFTQGAPTATVTPTPSPLAHTSVYILNEHFASARDGAFLVSLNAATGAERWRVGGNYALSFSHPPTLTADGATVYAPAMSRADDWATEQIAALYALSARDGSIGWKAPLPGWPSPSALLVVAGDVVLQATDNVRDNNRVPGVALTAFDARTGAQRWSFTARIWISQPLIRDGVAYLIVDVGKVVALRLSDGQPLWRTAPNTAGGATLTSLALDPESGALYGVEFGNHGALAELCPSDGRVLWRVPFSDDAAGPPIAAGGRIFIHTDYGTLAAFDAQTGEQRWRFVAPPGRNTSLAISDGAIYLGAEDGALYGVDAASGAQRWRFDATGWRAAAGVPEGYFKGVDSPVVVEGTVFFASTAWSGSTRGTPGAAYAVDSRTGTERWHFSVKGSVGGIFGIMLVAGP